MKLQSLAVIFVIIILPISIILSVYIGNQVETIRLQISYDTKLNNSTYDALKAFQLNTINNPSSEITNSKIRDIEASVNSFFNSVASNFNMEGYNRNILKEYVPALVYTMYDGYYIYSSYTNTIEDSDFVSKDEAAIEGIEPSTYQDGETLSGLKSYVYYSCRYKRGDDDFVITYSLDNYITIKGIINNKVVDDAGYLVDFVSGDIDGDIHYRGDLKIEEEELKETLMEESDTGVAYRRLYTYNKINGTKYYYDEENDIWFSFFGGKKTEEIDQKFKTTSDAGKRYFYNAKLFRNRIINEYKLGNLKPQDAVWEDGNHTNNEGKTIAEKNEWNNFNIFAITSVGIEEPNSNFNQHRRAVIKYSIEKNLSNAISNYNNYTGSSNDFQMPKLKETDWDKLANHISIISFLQGLNIGGKVYNGYSLITNNKNEEVVSEDSIYMLEYKLSTPIYHRITENNLKFLNVMGIWNIDLERKTKRLSNGTYNYYYPIYGLGSYSSIVNQNETGDGENIYKYLLTTLNGHADNNARNLTIKYFTALGRERYTSYKMENDYKKLQKEQHP